MKTIDWGKLGERLFLRRWYVWLALLLVLLIPAFLGLGRLEMDSSNDSFMPQDDPVTLKNEEFKEIFGSKEFFYLLIETDDLYSSKNLQRLRALEEDLWENLPFVDDITSIYSAESMEADEGFLRVESLEDQGIPGDSSGLAALRDRHMQSLLFPGRILSKDGSAAGILVSLEDFPDRVWARTEEGYSPFDKAYLQRDRVVLASDVSYELPSEPGWMELADPRKDAVATLYALLADHRSEDFRISLTGMPYIDYQVDVLTEKETSFFGMLSACAAVLLLVILFRSFRAVLAPVTVFLLTLLYVFGLMPYVHMKISLMTVILIPLILVISVGYSIHMINRIRTVLKQGVTSRKEALVEAYAHSAWPCLLTALTTAAGFLSFLFVPIKPIRHLGVLSAVGTMLAFLLVMILVPLFYWPGKASTEAIKESGKDRTSVWTQWNAFLFKRRKPILWIFLGLGLFMLWGAFSIRPSSDMMETIGSEAAFVKESQYVANRLGGVYSAEFLIELPEEGLGKTPAVLQTLQDAAEKAAQYPDVSLTLSLADLVLELDRVLQEKDRSLARIPEDPSTLAQYLLLYEMSGGSALADWTDYGYQTLRLSILLKGSSSEFESFAAEMLLFLEEQLPPGTEVSLTGEMPVMIRMMELLTQSQIRSCLAALGFIALLLLLILRSVRLGLLAVIPNLFPIVVILGLMGWLGFSLDMVTAMVAPMLIGIAVDDTMHFFIHYRQQRKISSSAREASLHTFLSVGNALTATSVVLAGGFILFAFSQMRSLQHLGILAAAGIVSALAADILLSPLLLDLFEGGKNE